MLIEKSKTFLVIAFILNVQSSFASPNNEPEIKFDRSVDFDPSLSQPDPFSGKPIPPKIFVQHALLRRFLDEHETQLLHAYENEEWLVRRDFKYLKAKIFNYTADKKSIFLRGVYLSENDKIVGYALAEELYLFQQGDETISQSVASLPTANSSYAEYLQDTPKYGRIEIHETAREGYVEQYALYFYPSGAMTLILDAFFPQKYQGRLKNTIGKALARFLRRHDLISAREESVNSGRETRSIEEDGEEQDIGPEMD